MATVGDPLEELVLDEVVQPFPAFVAETGIRSVEVLAQEDVAGVLGILGFTDFLMEHHQWLVRLEGEGASLVLHFVIGRVERQVEDRQGEHHLGEVAGGVDEVAREEGLSFGIGRVVVPEGVDQDEVGVLALDRQLVVVVLGPFLRGRELSVELTGLAPFHSARIEVAEVDAFLFFTCPCHLVS